MKKTLYVLGFAYDQFGAVAMIKKNRPKFQLGKWNGIGGHVEADDIDPHHAMEREFREETSMIIDNWRLVGAMEDETKFRILVFTSKVDLLHVHTCSDEPVRVFTAAEQLDMLGGMAFPTLENIQSLLALTKMGPGHDGIIPWFDLTYRSENPQS